MNSSILREVSKLCEAHPAIVAVYLFGSVASGKSRPTSDLDLALLLDRGAEDAFPLLPFISTLERLCQTRVDVVILNKAGDLLRHQVRKSGRLIYDRDPEKRKRFEVYGRKTYQDFLYLHRKYVKKILYGF